MYTQYAASALAAGMASRALIGSIFPLFALQMVSLPPFPLLAVLIDCTVSTINSPRSNVVIGRIISLFSAYSFRFRKVWTAIEEVE